MIRTSLLALATGAICAFFTLPNAAAQTYTLRYTPKKGTEYRYQTSMDMSQSMNQGGMDMSIGINMNTNMNVKVVNARKNENELKLSFKNAQMSITGLAAVGAGNDTNIAIDRLNDANVTFKTNGRGKVLSYDRAGIDNNEDQAVQQFGSGLRQVTNGFSLEYPEKALKKGDSWTVTTHDTSARGESGSMITSSNVIYTFDGIVDTLGIKCARIFSKSSSMIIEGSMQMQGMDMVVDADGSLQSVNYVELSTGMPVASRMTNQMDMRLALSGQQNMIMPMQTDLKVSVVRIP
ncbi:MAG TPA: hypothetical protein VEC36_11170 [Patescibacteria group bacterium]|nr:hypothetical protein [Patescibacteria group bacterium]